MILLKEGINKYNLGPPTSNPSDKSYLWALKLYIKSNQTFNKSAFGVLMLTTEGKPGMCDVRFQTGMSVLVPVFTGWVRTDERLRFHTCAYLYTIVRIDTKFINRWEGFEIGFQLFNDNEMSFHLLDPSINNSTTITYHWKLIKYIDSTQNIRLFNLTSQQYSWLMALRECKQHGMTLPHLMDRKSTTAKILHRFVSPPFAFFVGLIRKVGFFNKLDKHNKIRVILMISENAFQSFIILTMVTDFTIACGCGSMNSVVHEFSKSYLE